MFATISQFLRTGLKRQWLKPIGTRKHFAREKSRGNKEEVSITARFPPQIIRGHSLQPRISVNPRARRSHRDDRPEQVNRRSETGVLVPQAQHDHCLVIGELTTIDSDYRFLFHGRFPYTR
jgi:hypothetical protein